MADAAKFTGWHLLGLTWKRSKRAPRTKEPVTTKTAMSPLRTLLPGRSNSIKSELERGTFLPTDKPLKYR